MPCAQGTRTDNTGRDMHLQVGLLLDGQRGHAHVNELDALTTGDRRTDDGGDDAGAGVQR